MQKKKVAIIGHFGGDKNLLDGQTVKTKILFQELKKRTDWEIQIVDTFYKKKHPILLMMQTLITLLSTKNIIVLLSGNGMKFYFPILSFFAEKFGTRIFHDVIGGNLNDYVKKYPQFQKYLCSFQVNWVETTKMKMLLNKSGIYNVEVLPNFKCFQNIGNNKIISFSKNKPYPLCTFSRVMKEKGIEDAVVAVKAVNTRLGRKVYELDIYGQVDPDQTEWFDTLQRDFPDYISYKGMVPYDKSVETLKDYFALLFPTRFYTEGVPGTIIDAYAAGVPVIAAKWESFANVVEDGVTGIGYSFGDKEALVDCLCYAYQNVEKWNAMRYQCLEEAKKYQPEEVLKVIIEQIEGG